jgi:hypothetical protein
MVPGITGTGTGTVQAAILCVSKHKLCAGATVPGYYRHRYRNGTGSYLMYRNTNFLRGLQYLVITCTVDGTGTVLVAILCIETQSLCGGYGTRYYWYRYTCTGTVLVAILCIETLSLCGGYITRYYRYPCWYYRYPGPVQERYW